MLGRTPGSIVAVRPMKDGVIADFDITATMLERFIRTTAHSGIFSHPRIVIALPSGVTEVERRAVEDAAEQAGGRNKNKCRNGKGETDFKTNRSAEADQ